MAPATEAGSFLVCGLGSLGQQCVRILKEFGVGVSAIEMVEPTHWEIPNLPKLLDVLWIGDCRQYSVLERANIHHCRAVLLVTSNERVNLEAAFAVRSLNSDVRIIVRSAQENLNQLLEQTLGNFVAFEPTQLPAAAFALAAMGGEVRGIFSLGQQLLRVVNVSMSPTNPWCNCRQLHELNSPHRRVLNHAHATTESIQGFHQWDPQAMVQAGDVITLIEASQERSQVPIQQPRSKASRLWQGVIWTGWQTFMTGWQEFRRSAQQSQTSRVALISGMTMVGLFILGTLLYKVYYPDISLRDALNVSLVLVLGGYEELFAGLQVPVSVPWWLQLFSLMLTVAGTLFVGILYAFLTESVLAARFQFLKRRPSMPKQDHMIIVGLGRVGRQVARLLQDLKQPCVGISSTALEPEILSEMSLIVGKPSTALARVNLATAKSIVVVTDDEVTNLEIGLMAREANPDINLVIRTVDPMFSQNVARLLPYARVLGAYALAAEAFAAAAFGENVIDLFRLENQTMLVTDYQIEVGDTLAGHLLAEIAYGYNVVPILHDRPDYPSPHVMPSDDIRLHGGDRLVVLATIAGLQRVERGELLPPTCTVQIEKAFSPAAAFEGGNAIARMTNLDLSQARALMDHLPATLPMPLYTHQAQRLVRTLRKMGVIAHVGRG